ncbi:hypothetical protein ERO13_D08G098266v2 [Gossypium hirsutum]|uniref:Secreted protein n=2 Tax=Gossypium TaxID=3633 RepID=A0A5D2TVR4_GOSMU|nr:hypothetical protein ERO13_D08G098266v2 [Gossypium hirsutum]TYH57743.1 hypothetical protein ES332_D08G111100v1 [Gossypium tomentosum]TYI68735.1 hypothetical protein E1A91_D08G108800v1 [Gossypium mustelinum]
MYLLFFFLALFLCNLLPLLAGSCAISSSESILLQHIPLTAYFVLKSLLIISCKHSKNASCTGVISAKLLEMVISCFTADFDASSSNIQPYAD